MVDFFVKSILSLGILYVFYLLFLSRLKTFRFNRYFLLGSLIFSLLIPLISIPVNDTALPIIQSAGKVSLSSAIEYSGEFIASKEVEQNAMISYLPYFYAAISLILLLRFSANLFSIAKTIIKNQKIKKAGYSIVLLSNQIIPHSFFRYVLVNEHQYQADTIDEALIQHEITHCRQWHSLDILWIELIKVLFWINPFIWLMKKSVQLNHEFLADNKVLLNHDLANYKNLLVNLVIKHNSGILISNFNYSLTKQRLKMMTKKFSLSKSIFGMLTSILIVLILITTLSFSQKSVSETVGLAQGKEWQLPSLKNHGIEIESQFYDYKQIFKARRKALNQEKSTLRNNAFFKDNDIEGYNISSAETASYDLKSKGIKVETEPYSEGLDSQKITTDKPDVEATILEEGIYFLGDKKTSLRKIKKVLRDHAERNDDLYIRLYIENGVEYNYIEKFRRTFPKMSNENDIILEFIDLEPNSTSLSITGSVKDEFGNGLKNIAIIAKGTRIGTNTSENGNFSLMLPASTRSLVIYQKDFEKIEIPYNDLVSMDLKNLSFTLSK
jgi:hypothetical protein